CGAGPFRAVAPRPADAEDAYPVGRLGEPGQRREDGDAPAQERPGFGKVQRFRQRDGPGPVRADVGREPAAMTDDGELRLRAKVMFPDMHWRQCMQLPELQPTPTRCPTLSPLAFGPTAVTRPMTSWPRIAGYCEMPQSLFKTERSE